MLVQKTQHNQTKMHNLQDVVKFSQIATCNPKFCPESSGMQMHTPSSSLNLQYTVLHSQFNCQVCWRHFSIGCLSRKAHWTSTRKLWPHRTQVCALMFLRGTKRLFSVRNYHWKTNSRVQKARLCIFPLNGSSLNHLLHIVMMINITSDELVFILSIITIFCPIVRRKWPYEHFPNW